MYVTPWRMLLLEKLTVTQLVKKLPIPNSLPFMEPKDSLLCSEVPATAVYPEPHASSTQPPNLFPYDPF